MTIASITVRHRRALALGGASVLLHVLALWWVLPQLNAAPVEGETVIETRLIAMPLPEPKPEQPPPKPQPKPPVRKRPAPPRPVAPPAAPLAQAAPAEAFEPGAAEKLSAVQSVPEATPEPAPPPEPAPAPPAARQYRVDLPPSSRIVLGVERTDADGTRWHGEAELSWKLAGDSYRMKVEVGISLLVARVNLLVLESEGKIGAAGFAPVTMTEKRRGKALTATHFNQQDGRITFSASAASFGWLPGAQDKATVPLQLAAIARGDASQLDGGADILVGEDKDASVFRFVALGQEEIDTRLGRMRALHLSRPPRAGAYGSRLDIWLAPGAGWLPVQIRNTEASGAVTTQTVNKIETMDAGT